MRATRSEESIRKSLERYQGKLTTAAKAVEVVRSGDRVFVGTACATPKNLVMALEKLDRKLADVELFHFITHGAIPFQGAEPSTRFRHTSFFVSSDTREVVKTGAGDYVPISLLQACTLIDNGRLAPDVAFIQVSLPDEEGQVSLGVSVDITSKMVAKARKVIAEVNPHMPFTNGDSCIPADCIDSMVLVDTPIIEYTHLPVEDAVSSKIAEYVASIIEDGSTLQIGLGRIPNEMLKHLDHRRNLGIHSDVITDAVIDLIEKGVITGDEKSDNRGRIVASYCLGTRRLYDLIDNNPLFAFHPIDYICDPYVLAKGTRMVSVTEALAIDLTGQVCADQLEGEFLSGVSTQPEFLRGAACSPGGKPIICLSSTTEDGSASRIRPLLHGGDGVTIARSEVHYVITEYGTAYLFGKSIRERALALIEIAHPAFREELLAEAKRLGYVHENQYLKSRVAYPWYAASEVCLKNGVYVRIRPSRASDERGLRDLFYHMTPHDVHTRFFIRLDSLSFSTAQNMCNVDYTHDMGFVATIGNKEDERVIGSACYYADKKTKLADVAFMIRPEWQNLGLGSHFQRKMIDYAIQQGIRGFTAVIMKCNEKMLRLCRQFPDVKVTSSPDTLEVQLLFDACGSIRPEQPSERGDACLSPSSP